MVGNNKSSRVKSVLDFLRVLDSERSEGNIVFYAMCVFTLISVNTNWGRKIIGSGQIRILWYGRLMEIVLYRSFFTELSMFSLTKLDKPRLLFWVLENSSYLTQHVLQNFKFDRILWYWTFSCEFFKFKDMQIKRISLESFYEFNDKVWLSSST